MSPVNSSVVDEQGEHARRMAGGVQRLDGQAADLDLVARVEVAGRAGHALLGVGEHGRVRPALERRAQLRDVVAVVVGEQDVGDVERRARRPWRTAGPSGRPRRPGTRRCSARPRRGTCWTARNRSWSARRSWPWTVLSAALWSSSTRATGSVRSTAPSPSTRRSASRSAGGCRSATRRSTSSWACPGDGDRLELTYNHGVDSYELGTGYNHIALTVDDIEGDADAASASRASSPRSRRTACARAAR